MPVATKPFEAFELKYDMSNWREALDFIGNGEVTPKEPDLPEYIEFLNGNEWQFASGPCFLAKTEEGNIEFWEYEAFIERFEEYSGSDEDSKEKDLQ